MLTRGDRVGRYEVLSPLGAGGMGEVYRARDTELGREVALKTLLGSSAPDPHRLARLEREARVLASLNHPGIATLYGIERPNGGPGILVMELVEGAPLSELVPRPVGEVVAIARQIAEALEAAHAGGVLHRDLKPSNIRLTPEGRVKLLDFGVAKLIEDDETLDVGVDQPTKSGELVGTAQYMSPEQLRGEDVDRRTDVWSFGCVLFELLTARHPFPGSTVHQVVASVLEREPDWESLPPDTPGVLGRLLERCLRKKRERRLQDVGDARLELEEMLEPGAGRARGPGLAEGTPYPGLRPFTEDDAARFLGRESEVDALWRRLETRNLLAVIGPSGVGKSSFVRAGVAASRPPGWATLVTAPGTSPLLTLGQALAPALASDPAALRQLLRFEDAGVAYELLVRWRKRHGRALLVVDPFEELFTLNPPETQAGFSNLLARLANEGDVHVLLSLRDDFLMRCQEQPALLPVFDSLIPLGPLRGPALRRALIEPASQLGVEFEDESLVDEMLREVDGERGALPLLAFAVSRLWEMRDPKTKQLRRGAYQRIGGVSGALAHHAEATLGRIGTQHENLVRDIFRSLVTAQGTRAEVERERLLGVFPDRGAAEAVLNRLVDARLLTAYDLDGTRDHPGGHRVEIVHESLLRAWPRLVRWQAQDADAMVLRDQLRQAAEVWDARGRREDLLWSGTAYREFELWRERHNVHLGFREGAFAEAMVARSRKLRRRWRVAVGGVAAAAVVVAGVVAVSWQQEAAARRGAEASRLVALGRLELEVEPTAALAYARTSLEIHDTAEARRLAVEALWRGPTARVLSLPPGLSCTSLATDPAGRWVACGRWRSALATDSLPGVGTRHESRLAIRAVRGGDGPAPPEASDRAAALWSMEGVRVGEQPPEELLPYLDEDDRLVVNWSRTAGGTLVRREARPAAVPPALSWTDRDGTFQELSASGSELLYSRGTALWRRRVGDGPAREVRVGQHPSAVRQAGFHERTGTVISVGEDRGIVLWSPRSDEPLHSRQGLDASIFTFPRLDPSGTRLAWHSVAERAAVLWDLTGPPDADPLLLRRRSIVGDMGDMVFVSDGRWLATAIDDAVAFWPVELPWPRVLRGHASAVVSIAFGPDSRHLVSCGNDGARIWPLTPDGGHQRAIECERPYTCYGVAVDPRGGRVLVAATASAGFVASFDGGAPETVVRVPPTESIRAAAFDLDGQRAAVAAVSSVHARDRRLHVVEGRKNDVRSYPLPGAGVSSAESGGVYALRFVRGGRLLSVGDAGIVSWDPSTGENETLYAPGCGTMDSSGDGRRVVVGCLADRPREHGARQPPSSEVFLLELDTGARRRIVGHGDSVQAVGIDPSGELIATGDTTGVVRVARWNDAAPHLLLGARGVVSSVAFSPDGQWVGAAAGNDVWLWPMPDLSEPPLQDLPHDDLLARLDSLTNLRLVEDDSTELGYAIEVGAFPGWTTVPSW